MKAYIEQLLRDVADPIAGRNRMREYLQARILESLQRTGAGLDTTLIRRHATLRLQHHDRASLLSGKLHAIFQRRYVKGRDLYDLMWYLSDPDWPNPNLALLQNALRQTGWDGETPNQNNWRPLLCQRLGKIDWRKSVADVKPFLERSDEVDLLTKENFDKLLGCSLG